MHLHYTPNFHVTTMSSAILWCSTAHFGPVISPFNQFLLVTHLYEWDPKCSSLDMVIDILTDLPYKLEGREPGIKSFCNVIGQYKSCTWAFDDQNKFWEIAYQDWNPGLCICSLAVPGEVAQRSVCLHPSQFPQHQGMQPRCGGICSTN